MMKRSIAALVLLSAVLAGSAAWYYWGPSTAPEGQPPLIVLQPENLAEFQTSFNQASGSVRVVALLSPT
jgi:hypothetical protein